MYDLGYQTLPSCLAVTASSLRFEEHLFLWFYTLVRTEMFVKNQFLWIKSSILSGVLKFLMRINSEIVLTQFFNSW